MPYEITVDGLDEFARALRQLDATHPRALRLALNKAAALVIATGRPRVPRRTGRAQRSIRPASTRTAARVTAGGPVAPWYPWLDFGGRVGPKRSVQRAFRPKGRYLYPAYFALRDSGEFAQLLERELRRVAERAGLVLD